MPTEWTIDELVARVAAVLEGAAYPGVPNGRVRDVPDARAIRWYSTIGLVDRPARMRGRTALYGPRHLWQIVAIKRRQAEGLRIADIQAELAGAPDDVLLEIADLPDAPESDPSPTPEPARDPSPRRPVSPGRPLSPTPTLPGDPPLPAEPRRPAEPVPGVPPVPEIPGLPPGPDVPPLPLGPDLPVPPTAPRPDLPPVPPTPLKPFEPRRPLPFGPEPAAPGPLTPPPGRPEPDRGDEPPESGPPAGLTASAPRDRFWTGRPSAGAPSADAPPSPGASSGDRLPQPSDLMTGVPLRVDVVLLLHAAPDAEDLAAIHAAARPLLDVLTDRGLLRNI